MSNLSKSLDDYRQEGVHGAYYAKEKEFVKMTGELGNLRDYEIALHLSNALGEDIDTNRINMSKTHIEGDHLFVTVTEKKYSQDTIQEKYYDLSVYKEGRARLMPTSDGKYEMSVTFDSSFNRTKAKVTRRGSKIH